MLVYQTKVLFRYYAEIHMEQYNVKPYLNSYKQTEEQKNKLNKNNLRKDSLYHSN